MGGAGGVSVYVTAATLDMVGAFVKEGRVLSAANIARLGEVQTAMEQAAKALGAVLASPQPPDGGKAAPEMETCSDEPVSQVEGADGTSGTDEAEIPPEALAAIAGIVRAVVAATNEG